MSIINTGNFRIGKQQIGIGGTNQILHSYPTSEELNNAYPKFEREYNWEYYCEEEVISRCTLIDENHNPTDFSPYWRRIVSVKLV